MKKKCKIVELEGSINSPIGTLFRTTKGDEIGKLFTTESLCISAESRILYITSNDEIKIGDWCIINYKFNNASIDQIKSISSKKSFCITKRNYELMTSRNIKIIASTDKSLNLPGIPFSFIQKYVKENGKIDKVMVELEDYSIAKELKINLNNTILIYPTKVYDIKEIESILFQYADEHGLLSCKQYIESFNKWIRNNL